MRKNSCDKPAKPGLKYCCRRHFYADVHRKQIQAGIVLGSAAVAKGNLFREVTREKSGRSSCAIPFFHVSLGKCGPGSCASLSQSHVDVHEFVNTSRVRQVLFCELYTAMKFKPHNVMGLLCGRMAS